MELRRLGAIAALCLISSGAGAVQIDSVRIARCENALINVLTLRKRPEWLDFTFSEPVHVGSKILRVAPTKNAVKKIVRQVVSGENFENWIHSQFSTTEIFDVPREIDGLFADQVPYTYLVTPERLSFAKAPPGLFSDLLSKHLLLARRSEKVEFAGEFMIDHSAKVVIIDNASGTFLPSAADLESVRALFIEIFPGFEIKTLSKSTVRYRETAAEFVKTFENVLTGNPTQTIEERIDELFAINARHTLGELNEYLGISGEFSPSLAIPRAVLREFEGYLGAYQTSADLVKDAITLGMDKETVTALLEQAEIRRGAFRNYLVLRGWTDPTRTPLISLRKILEKSTLDQIEEISRLGDQVTTTIDALAGETAPDLTDENGIQAFQKKLRKILFLVGAENRNVFLNGSGGVPSSSFFTIKREDYLAVIHWVQELGNLRDQIEVSRMLAKASGGNVTEMDIFRRIEASGRYASPYPSATEILRELKASGVLERFRFAFSARRS